MKNKVSILLRWFVGLQLMASSLAKALSSNVSVEVGSWTAPPYAHFGVVWFLAISGAVVVLFGWTKWSKRLSVSLYVLFVVLLVTQITIGRSSCGCFGDIQISPWIMLANDVLIIAALVWSAKSTMAFPRHFAARAAGAALFGLGVLTTAIWHQYDVEKQRVVSYDDLAPLVRRGRWIQIEYRASCVHCQELMDEWIIAAQAAEETPAIRFAFNSVDGEGNANADMDDKVKAAGLTLVSSVQPKLKVPRYRYIDHSQVLLDTAQWSEAVGAYHYMLGFLVQTGPSANQTPVVKATAAQFQYAAVPRPPEPSMDIKRMFLASAGVLILHLLGFLVALVSSIKHKSVNRRK